MPAPPKPNIILFFSDDMGYSDIGCYCGDERVLLFEHYGRAAIRKGPWKLVRAGETQPWELHAIEEDRSESNNLSEKHPEKVRQLRELWEKGAERSYIDPKPGSKKKR